MEHYVTLFDHKFLPQGLVLHSSLQQYASPCTLWVVCMDEKAEHQLRQLDLPGLRVLPLASVEDPELRAAKANRSWTEYCWTLTPSICLYLLKNHPECSRVTYVDADLAFFSSPTPFFRELESAAKGVLITEHAYAPRYASSTHLAGRFCVQFLTFSNDAKALAVLQHWREQCLESCTAVATVGAPGFGDQKYLEAWPEQHGDIVHVLQQVDQTLAPWNVDHFQEQANAPYFSVFFHFHGFRIVGRNLLRLSSTYRIRRGRHIYDRYLQLLDDQVRKMQAHGFDVPVISWRSERWWLLRTLKRFAFQHLKMRRHRFPVGLTGNSAPQA
ncbi:MAG: glycosyl transferase [Opitutus sp.]